MKSSINFYSRVLGFQKLLKPYSLNNCKKEMLEYHLEVKFDRRVPFGPSNQIPS